MGVLEITVFNISEDFYEDFEKVNETSVFTDEVYETYESVQKIYYKAYIRVFNNFSRIPGIYTEEDNEELKIWIQDDLENIYEQNKSQVNNVRMSEHEKIFGNSLIVSPRTRIEGYLIFPEIDRKAQILRLFVRTSSGEVFYEFEK